MKKKPQKFIAVVLAIISLLSACNLGVFAGYFSGSPSNGGGTPSSSADEQFKIRGYKGDINRPQGYRFSIIDAGGNTLMNDNETKFRTIDILRTGANDASKLQYKLNKYQIRAKYVDPNGDINLNLGDSGTAAYGKKSEGELSNISPLPDTTGIGSWIENATNRNVVLSAVGYSGALNTNRIVIEPLYCISYNGYFMLLTVSEMALMNIHYNQGNAGNAYTTGHYTNYHFPASLMLVSGNDTDLGLSVKAYKKSGYSESNPYTNDEIIKNGLGMALYYEKNSDGTPKMPNNTHTMTISYHKNDGSGIKTSFSYVIENSNTMVDIYSPALLNIVSDKDFSKDGYGFEGWATSGYNTEIEILCVIYN